MSASSSIQRSTNSGFSPAGTVTTIASGLGSDGSFDDSGLTPNTTYYYRIVAVNSFGNTFSTSATVVTATGLSTAPNAPAIAKIGTSTLTVELAALPAEADSLSIQRSTASNFSPVNTIATGLAGNDKYDDSGLTPNTTYYYRAVVVNSFGSVTGASVQTATRDGKAPAPNAPSLGKVGPNTLTVELPSLPTEADSLSVQRATNSGFTTGLSTIATGLSGGATYDDSGLTPNTLYYYRAIAVNSFGSTNGASASTTTTSGLSAAPNVPLFGLVRSTTLTVTPPALPAEAASLTLQRSTASTFASPTNLITGLTTGANYDDSGLTANTLYYYRALAVNSFGSVVGTSATVTTLPALVKTWSVGAPIGEDYDSNGDTVYNGRITAPQDQRTAPHNPVKVVVKPGKLVSCAVEDATDYDDWTATAGSGDEADTILSYTWACSGGGFVDGSGNLQPTITGKSANWKAPAVPGQSFTLSCTIKDTPTAVTSPDTGTRDDSDLVRTVQVQTYSVTMTPEKEVMAAGAIGNDGHKSEVTFTVKDADNAPVPGVTVDAPVDISDGRGVAPTTDAIVTVRSGVTDANGVIKGDFLSGTRTQTATMKLFYDPADGPQGPTGPPANPAGLGPAFDLPQVWNELAGTPAASICPPYFSFDGPTDIGYIMTFDGGKPISGHSLTFENVKIMGWEWDPDLEVDVDGDNETDYTGDYVEHVLYEREDAEEDLGPDGAYNDLVSFGGVSEGSGANAGKYSSIMTVEDYVDPEGYIDFFVEKIWVDAVDGSTHKKDAE